MVPNAKIEMGRRARSTCLISLEFNIQASLASPNGVTIKDPNPAGHAQAVLTVVNP
jgi:hypothetical protein